jgi:type I restriction enzyme S subunit
MNKILEKLLDGADVEWKTLSEVAFDFGRGKSKHRPRNDNRLYGGEIPFIQTGDIRNSPHIISKYSQTYNELGLKQSKLWPKGTLCITIAANIAETAILGFDSCFPDSVIGFVANPKKADAHYVEYLLSSFKSKIQAKSTGSAQSNIKLATFESFLFPFPNISKQKEIVKTLNKFQTLTNFISGSLSCEIESRQKQYEYYCKRLKKTNLKNNFEALFKGIKQESELRKKQIKYYRDMLLDFPKPDKIDEPVQEPAQKSLFK